MSEPVHGHKVMEMMLRTQKAYTRESLEAAIREEFGPGTRFYTCAEQNLTAGELIDLLNERGKLFDKGDGFSVDPDRMCDD